MADSSPLRPPSSLFNKKLSSPSPLTPRALIGVNITDCVVKSNELGPPSLPVAIRTFYNPFQNTALFRLSASIILEQTRIQDADAHIHTGTAVGLGMNESISESRRSADDPQPQPTTFYLEIRPEHVYKLSVVQDVLLHFYLKEPRLITLVAPCLVPPLQASTVPNELVTLGRLATCSTLSVYLPDQGPSAALFQRSRSALVALSHALDCGAHNDKFVALHPNAETVDRRCLFRGAGGRVVDLDSELFLPDSLPAFLLPPGTPEQPSHAATPTEPASSNGPEVLPPTYSSIPAACNPLTTISSSLSTRPQKKRRRMYSVSSSSSSTSHDIQPTKFYHETRPQELANEEEAKQITELLQRGAEQEKRLRILLQELEKKNAAIDKQCAKMDRAYQKMKALLDAATQDNHLSASSQSVPASPSQSQVCTCTTSVASPASAVTPESPSADGSPPPTPPGPRLRRYIDWAVHRLGRQIDAHKFATEKYVEGELEETSVKWDDEVAALISDEVEKQLDSRAEGLERNVREKIVERLTD